MQSTKIPIATLDPVLYYEDKGRTVYVDFPLTYLSDYFFESTRFPVQTRDEYDWTGRSELLSVLETGPLSLDMAQNSSPVFAPYVELAKLNQLGTMMKSLRGPAFTPDFCEQVIIEPWRKVEQEYEHFLIVPQPVWCEHLLGFLDYITPESIARVKCEKLFECLRNGRARMIIQIPWEGGWWAPDHYQNYRNFLTRMNLPEDAITFVMPLSKPAEQKMRDWFGMRVHTFSYFEYFPREFREHFFEDKEQVEKYKQELLDSLDSGKWQFPFFNHTGCATPDRVLLLSLLDRMGGQWNLSNDLNESTTLCVVKIEDRIKANQDYYEKLVGSARVRKVLQILHDWHRKGVQCRQVFDSYDLEEDLWRFDSAIEVFAETIDRDYTENPLEGTNCLHFMTEKTLKPLSSLHPFFLLGNKGCLEDLKQRGYRTFSKLWDERYAEEEDFVGRILLVSWELEKLTQYTAEQRTELIQSIKPDLIYNFDLRAERGRSGKEEFLKLLESELCE